MKDCKSFPRWLDSNTLRRQDERDCPDGPRFKAMGNSMAVPVMRWIGEGIEQINRIPKQNQRYRSWGSYESKTDRNKFAN